jgi:hypothetical protein
MTAYLAECYWPGVTEQKVADLLTRACAAAQELRELGRPVEITESWLMPADEVAFLIVDAETLEEARAVSERAGVPFERIVEAVAVQPAV